MGFATNLFIAGNGLVIGNPYPHVDVSMAMNRATARVQTEPNLVLALRQCREELQM